MFAGATRYPIIPGTLASNASVSAFAITRMIVVSDSFSVVCNPQQSIMALRWVWGHSTTHYLAQLSLASRDAFYFSFAGKTFRRFGVSFCVCHEEHPKPRDRPGARVRCRFVAVTRDTGPNTNPSRARMLYGIAPNIICLLPVL